MERKLVIFGVRRIEVHKQEANRRSKGSPQIYPVTGGQEFGFREVDSEHKFTSGHIFIIKQFIKVHFQHGLCAISFVKSYKNGRA